MEIRNKKLEIKDFEALRGDVLEQWPTGKGIKIEDGIKYQQTIPDSKNFAKVLKKADDEQKVLLQPRAGVALVDEHIRLLKFLEPHCDLLPTTIDAYTRLNRFEEAQKGIDRSLQAGQSLLNGCPLVNHGVDQCKRIVEALEKPVEVRHGTPDARLLAEITLAGGFTSYEGGGISYNIPYTKKVALEKSIFDWQYVDRLVGIYEQEGININREPFGPLTGTLVAPFISHSVAIIEGLLALEQGVRSITLGYGQAGNMVQDVAAMQALRKLGHEFFQGHGFTDYELTTVFHQWMGGFPEDEARAFSVISWGGTVGALGKASKVIVKTPHEAMGIPTKEANVQGLKATRQVVSMLHDQFLPVSVAVDDEVEMICREVRCVMRKVFELGEGDLAMGAVRAIKAGVIDIPFAPSVYNKGKLLPVRDNTGAIRIFDKGFVPFDDDVWAFHKDKIQERAKAEERDACFQMVIDDIYAISKGKLVGRPS